MHNSNCLNCDSPVIGKYCADCGQKTATHRITPKHFIMHDLVHGVLHIDRGIPFTLKEVFTRPGYAAQDYIKGKRVKYYNVFYLILLTIGFLLIANGHTDLAIDKIQQSQKLPLVVATFIALVFNYFKYFLLLLLPLFSLSGLIVFNRLTYNFFEHFIIAGYALLGIFIISLAGTLSGKLWEPAEAILSLLMFIYMAWVYYQVTSQKYSVGGFIWRMACFILLVILFYIVVLSFMAALIVSL